MQGLPAICPGFGLAGAYSFEPWFEPMLQHWIQLPVMAQAPAGLQSIMRMAGPGQMAWPDESSPADLKLCMEINESMEARPVLYTGADRYEWKRPTCTLISTDYCSNSTPSSSWAEPPLR